MVMVDDKSYAIALIDLPKDIFVTIFQHCSLHSLLALSLSCRSLHDLVASIGWTTHQRVREQRGISWVPACLDDVSSPALLARLRYDALAAHNLRRRTFLWDRLVAKDWLEGDIPVLALGHARTRLVVGVERKLFVYRFTACEGGDGAPRVRLEGTYIINSPAMKEDNHLSLRTLAFLPSGDADCTLLAGFADGYVMRLTLPEATASADVDSNVQVQAEVLHRHDEDIRSVSVSDSFVFSLSRRRGVLSAFSSDSNLSFSDAPEPHFVDFDKYNTMTSFLLPSSSPGGPYLAIGSSSLAPLSVHALVEGSSIMSGRPTALLGLPNGEPCPKRLYMRAVNALAAAPPGFPGAHPGSVLVSSWADNVVRLYDTRVPPAVCDYWGSPMWVIPPVITLPGETNGAANSIATGGPVGTTVAASDHGADVKFWDVRSPRAPFATQDANTGRHGHGQLGDCGWRMAVSIGSSSVSALALAGARCFGVTKMGPFVLDFGVEHASNNASSFSTSPEFCVSSALA